MCRQVRETQWEWLAEETMDRLRDEQLALQSELLGARLDDNPELEEAVEEGEGEGMIKVEDGMDLTSVWVAGRRMECR